MSLADLEPKLKAFPDALLDFNKLALAFTDSSLLPKPDLLCLNEDVGTSLVGTSSDLPLLLPSNEVRFNQFNFNFSIISARKLARLKDQNFLQPINEADPVKDSHLLTT